MSIEVHRWPGFDDALERLRRKYPRIEQDIEDALRDDGGLAGRLDALPGYAHKLWKLRVASRDMRRGKQGGFRLIFYMEPGSQRELRVVHLLTIYAKSERAEVRSDELMRLWNRFWDYVKARR